MKTVAHAVTAWHTHRDWLALGVQIIAPLGTVVVSSIALWFSWLQSQESRRQAQISRREAQRVRKLTERNILASETQAETASAKLRFDLFEERYKAWNAFDDILGRFRDTVEQNAPRTSLEGLRDAQRRMDFLFDDDVNTPAKRLVSKVLQYDRDHKRIAKDIAAGGATMKEPMRVKVGERIDDTYDKIDELTERVRTAAKAHCRLEEIR